VSKLVAVLVGLGLLLAGASGAEARAGGRQALEWRPCDPGFECATARVPRDYARPHGPHLELALIRRPATDREHRIGSLFFNPGGPGGSGVGFVRFAPPPALAAFGRLYDIVGFDPRGVGASTPAVRDCGFRSGLDRFPRTETLDKPALLRAARDQIRRCEAANGRLLPHLNTANVARDLDRLRAAVGDQRLNYVGISYGTLIGATYTTLFPGRTGALVLDSPADADVWLNRPFEALREQNVSFERSLDRFLHWCSRRPAVCALDPEDPQDTFDALVAELNDAPLPAPSDSGGPPVSGDEVLLAAEESMYSKFFWAPFARALAQAQGGDGSGIRALSAVGEEGEATGAGFAIRASEVRYPRDVGRYLAEMRHNDRISEHFFFPGGYSGIARAMWPYAPRGAYHGPFRHPAGAPTPLVIGGTHDPATPYAWAKRFVSDLGNARLLTYRADGHAALTDLNPCVSVAFLSYIETGALPPEGATCTQSVPEPADAARRSAVPAGLDAWKRATRPAGPGG